MGSSRCGYLAAGAFWPATGNMGPWAQTVPGGDLTLLLSGVAPPHRQGLLTDAIQVDCVSSPSLGGSLLNVTNNKIVQP